MASRHGDQPTGPQRWLRRFTATRPGAWFFGRVLHRIDRVAFGWTGGRRTLTAIGEDLAVVAGNFGRQADPAWCLNLRREPRAHVVADGESHQVLAEELTGGAREAVWRRALEIYPGGAAYERRAGGRTLGVFLLRQDPGRCGN